MADESFRKELLADPACTAAMILPDLVGRELTDEEFEAVSGGFSFSGLLPKTKLFSRDMAMASSPLVSGKAKDKADCFLNMPINEAK